MPSAPEPWRGAARARLDEGLAALGLALPAPAREGLLDYLALLARWNRAYSLTAVRDPVEMVTRHLLDCLAALPHLPPGALCDLGSGAGLPGIPIALAEPHRPVTLLEASAKKARFLRHAVLALAPDRVAVACARAERWRPPRPFAVVAARAVGELAALARLAGPLLEAGGVLAALKGRHPAEELAALPAPWRVRAVHALAVPGLAAARHLVLLERP
ncbi:16S rRNA (guanine(527)-N(7))-methyltransferase RsmG [Inmirania thermothiophila]|uniref:Ribosomal RNA small subunit methyltransferase G n=1 Tax=Inmirania thermothiophila TaxID=1750597 RepID=A0A3N1Y6G3_9GAMM|nr:16S rRNA (guanine(527)-N(7))-methyltransferase RsmG [Inmirania thermothiophila]ROR34340.1 16S rRNA m(7)G-527 methyltransferase [Inmirania thermothiophila]